MTTMTKGTEWSAPADTRAAAPIVQVPAITTGEVTATEGAMVLPVRMALLQEKNTAEAPLMAEVAVHTVAALATANPV